jgi:hypothetical protein
VRWRITPDPTLFSSQDWLRGTQEVIDNGDYKQAWQALMAWQKAVGKPADPISGRLLKNLLASLQAGDDQEVSAEEIASTTEKLREKISRTLLPIERAYLVNEHFKWQLHANDIGDFIAADWIFDFLVRARQYAQQHNLSYDDRFTPPRRSIGNYGWSGSARMQIEGSAMDLQNFADAVCCLFVDANGERAYRKYPAQEFIHQNENSKAMRPIPSYEVAVAVVDGFVHAPEAALREDALRTLVVERQHIDERLQSLIALAQKTGKPSLVIGNNVGPARS